MSGPECIEKVRKQRYDLILMDSRMPRMSGTETLKEIKRLGLIDSTRVIVLTADAMAGAREKYMADGFDGYLMKPVRPDRMEEAIRGCLPEDKIKPPIVTARPNNSKTPEWLSDIEEIDADEGLKMCGDAETYLSTLESFSRYSDENVELFNKSLAEGDIEDFTIRIHALKSSSKLIGAMELSDMARDLEEAGDRRDIKYITEHAGKVLDTYMKLSESLKPLHSEEITIKTGGGLIDKDDIPKLYKHLKEYVEDFNDLAVGSMLAGIGHYKFPDEEEVDRYKALVRAHDAVDWDAMNQLLKEY